MKDKIKRFMIDKKELLIFVAVVVVVFATVITIASLALSDVPAVGDDPIGDQKPDPDVDTDPEPDPTPVVKFSLPVKGDYKVVRIFFDLTLTDEELESAVIINGSYMSNSQGMSYAKSDNSVFDVSAIYDGEIVSIDEDELDGTTVTIKHSDSIVSIYSSLSDVCVKVGDKITVGQNIAKASTSMVDVAAGVHVHLEVKVKNSHINPASVFGKEITDVPVGK